MGDRVRRVVGGVVHRRRYRPDGGGDAGGRCAAGPRLVGRRPPRRRRSPRRCRPRTRPPACPAVGPLPVCFLPCCFFGRLFLAGCRSAAASGALRVVLLASSADFSDGAAESSVSARGRRGSPWPSPWLPPLGRAAAAAAASATAPPAASGRAGGLLAGRFADVLRSAVRSSASSATVMSGAGAVASPGGVGSGAWNRTAGARGTGSGLRGHRFDARDGGAASGGVAVRGLAAARWAVRAPARPRSASAPTRRSWRRPPRSAAARSAALLVVPRPWPGPRAAPLARRRGGRSPLRRRPAWSLLVGGVVGFEHLLGSLRFGLRARSRR